MSKCDIRPEFECQNRISNGKIQYSAPVRMSKLDFECQNAILGPNLNFECQNSKFGSSSNIKIGFRMSQSDIRPEFEYQNMISNVKMQSSALIRMSKYDFESQNGIFGPDLNVGIGFRMSKCNILPQCV